MRAKRALAPARIAKAAARPASARAAADVDRRASACPCGGGCPRCAGSAKLAVSKPGDAAEREADAIATRALDATAAPRGEARAPLHAAAAPAAPAPFGLGAGSPLGEAERAFFAPRLGADLSGVRLHTDGRAAEAAAALRSHAFAQGPHLVFGRDEYRPETSAGRRLLAHELAHTLTAPPGVIHRTAYSDCSAAERPELEAAVSRAWSWLGTAYAMLREEPTPDRVRFALQLAFQNDSTAVVERVREVITAIMQGLPSATIECENPGGAEYWGFCNLMEARGFVRWTSALTATGNIHVCMGADIWGDLNDAERARVVMHEAAHLFANTADEGYFSGESCLDTAETLALDSADLLDNADSYACFVQLLLHHGVDALRGLLADRAGHTLTFTQSPPGDVDLRSGREHDVWFTAGIPRGRGVTELPSGFSTRFYLIDDAYNEYPMAALSGPVADFGSEGAVFIPAATRAQLIERGVRTGRVIALVRLPRMTYMFEVRVNFRF